MNAAKIIFLTLLFLVLLRLNDKRLECERKGGEYFYTALTCVRGEDVIELGE